MSDIEKFPVDPDQCPCHKDDIVELLSSLDMNKAGGLDNISACMLKATAHQLLIQLFLAVAHAPPFAMV